MYKSAMQVRRGFTPWIELLVVIAIIAILAALILPVFKSRIILKGEAHSMFQQRPADQFCHPHVCG